MGVRASDRRKVAVKVFSRVGLSPEDEATLMEEESILRSLHHPHVVTLLDFFKDTRFFYLVTEYLDGGDLLEHVAARSSYNEAQAREYARAVLLAVQHLHVTASVVHRDLKPDNVMIASVAQPLPLPQLQHQPLYPSYISHLMQRG